MRWMSSALSQMIRLRLVCLICDNWLVEKVDGFSYQNRSPSRSLRNWSISKHWTVGPTLEYDNKTERLFSVYSPRIRFTRKKIIYFLQNTYKLFNWFLKVEWRNCKKTWKLFSCHVCCTPIGRILIVGGHPGISLFCMLFSFQKLVFSPISLKVGWAPKNKPFFVCVFSLPAHALPTGLVVER